MPRYALTSPEIKWSKPTKRDYLSATIEGVIMTYYNLIQGYEAVKPRDKGRYIDKSYTAIDVIGRTKHIKDGVFIRQKDVMPGMADIKVEKIIPGGFRQVMWIEVKVGKDRQSDEQKAFEALCKERGERYRIVKSVDDFLDFIGWPVLNRVEVRSN